MRIRLRPAYTEDELAQVYSVSYDHTKWPDHIQRVKGTIDFARKFFPRPKSVADLSCGDATIARALGAPITILGDFVDGYDLCGPIENTLPSIGQVDLFICSETIEHLDNPDQVLVDIRHRANKLILTTPIGEIDANNPEHYWGWDHIGVRDMLLDTGWQPIAQEDLVTVPRYYDFQLWACRWKDSESVDLR